MRFAFVSPHLPHPGIAHAGGRFSWEWLRAISRSVDVDLIVPATPANVSAPRALASSVEITLIPPAPYDSKVASRLHHYRSGGISPGLSVLEGLRRSERFWRVLESADLVELHWQHLLPLVVDVRRRLGAVPISVCMHDVMTQKAGREARSAQRFRSRMGASIRVRRARKLEPRLLAQVDQVFTFTAKDVALLRDLGVKCPMLVVDPPVKVPPKPVVPSRPRALFTGAMSRPSNAESLRWFLDEVWPTVRTKVPVASMVVAGADPPKWLAHSAIPGLSVTGYVDDLDPFYRDAFLFVAPLRLGAGLKFKVLDAMAYGLPVVATSIAAEGILEQCGPECFAAVTDDPRRMAEAIVNLFTYPDIARVVGRRARSWVQRRYDFDETVQQALIEYRRMTAVREVAAGDSPWRASERTAEAHVGVSSPLPSETDPSGHR